MVGVEQIYKIDIIFYSVISNKLANRERISSYVPLGSALSLRLIMLDVPSPSYVGESVELTCSYDLGDDRLYSVKWYSILQYSMLMIQVYHRENIRIFALIN